MITNFLPKSNELIEQSIMFNESMRGFGYKCSVLIPTSVDLPEVGYHQNVSYDESTAFNAYISIDPHPSPKLLQNLGWNTEDDDTKPMICYISRYLQPTDSPRQVGGSWKEVLPVKYTRLVLEYDYQTSGKEFIVSKVSSNTFNPIYYIMMIVPYRPTVPNNSDPLQDANVRITDIQETDNDFKFIGSRLSQVGIKY